MEITSNRIEKLNLNPRGYLKTLQQQNWPINKGKHGLEGRRHLLPHLRHLQ